MRKNLIQTVEKDETGRKFIPNDWYAGGIPANVKSADSVFLETSYSFAAFHSTQKDALEIGEGTGTYDRASFVVGENGRVRVGTHVVLNGTTIIANQEVTIGNFCLLAWGSIITDSWSNQLEVEQRRQILNSAAEHPERILPAYNQTKPVTIGDNVWIGFDAVVLPGVNVGRGAVIGCKSVVEEDIPAYAVVAGNPARIIKRLPQDDTPASITEAFKKHII